MPKMTNTMQNERQAWPNVANTSSTAQGGGGSFRIGNL